jgi:hypothetical protein
MASGTMTERLAKLESEVAELRKKVDQIPEKPKWRQTVDKFTDNEGIQSILKEAMKLREADRKATRPKARPRRGKQ